MTGPHGLLGTKPSYDMMMGCDVLFMIGTSFPNSDWLPPEGSRKCVQIDIDPRYTANRYPVDVPPVDDSRLTLRELADARAQIASLVARAHRERSAPLVGDHGGPRPPI